MERSTPLLAQPELGPFGPGQGQRRHRRGVWWRVRVPWTVDRYLATEVLRITLLGVLAVSLVYTTFAAYQTVRSGLQLNFLWPLLVKTFAYPLYFSLPVSFLFGITLALGRMSSDLELTALRTHGFSYRQIYAPILALGLVLSGVSFYLNGWVVPSIHYARRNLHTYILDQLESLGSGINRTLLLPDNEGTLWVGAYSGTQIQQVRVDLVGGKESSIIPSLREYLPERLPGKVTVLARQGKIDILSGRQSVILSLRAVEIMMPETVRTASSPDVFHQKFAITDSVTIPLSFAPRAPSIKDRTYPELLAHLTRLRQDAQLIPREDGPGLAFAAYRPETDLPRIKSQISAAVTEIHRRLAFTFSCLAFPLLGISLTLLLGRWGRLVPFFIGNLVLVAVYYPLVMLGVSLGERGVLPQVSMALPNLVLVAIGVLLAKKVVIR